MQTLKTTITHIHIFDMGLTYELIDGNWVEKVEYEQVNQ